MKSALLAIAVLAAVLGGCAAPSREAQGQGAAVLSQEHFRSTATVEDSAQEGIATVSTVKGLQEKRALFGGTWGDNYLRAFIDKKTGRATIQLQQLIYYVDTGWYSFQTVGIETASGVQTRPLTVFRLGEGADCAGASHGCTRVEQVAIDLDEPLLRAVAGRQRPDQPVEWKFTFASLAGKVYRDTMSAAEVAGFLEAIDAYRAAKGLPVPSGS
jgi:hypothetical protein